MKASCKVGLQKTRRVVVDDERIITHLGKDLAVYGTPFLVRDIEGLCHGLLLDHLDPGEGSVGMRVDIEHLAATPKGMWVDLTATLAAIDGRVMTFTVEGHDRFDQVARCTHKRFVVDLEKTKQRLAAKIAKAAAEPAQ